MSAMVSNAALVSSVPRAWRGFGASSRQPIDGLESPFAAPGRDQTRGFSYDNSDVDPSALRRRGEFQDQVISFGGVLVSTEVGSAIVQAQAANGVASVSTGDAGRQIANYEFVQSLFGPAEPIQLSSPFDQ